MSWKPQFLSRISVYIYVAIISPNMERVPRVARLSLGVCDLSGRVSTTETAALSDWAGGHRPNTFDEGANVNR